MIALSEMLPNNGMDQGFNFPVALHNPYAPPFNQLQPFFGGDVGFQELVEVVWCFHFSPSQILRRN